MSRTVATSRRSALVAHVTAAKSPGDRALAGRARGGLMVMASILAVSLQASAQTVPRVSRTPRAISAVGGLVGLVRAQANGDEIWYNGPGLYLRGGLQFREEFGVDLEGSGAYFTDFSAANWALRLALTAAWTPHDRVSLGTGLSVTSATERPGSGLLTFSASGASGSSSREDRTAMLYGIPIRVSLHFGGRNRHGARRGFELTARTDLGVGSSGRFGLGAWLGCGYAVF